MRDYEFRGKCIDKNWNQYTKGEWVYGYLFKTWEQIYILWGTINGVPKMVEVDPSTVGQFTGLVDKNGKKIYEGDIIELIDRHVIITWNKYVSSYDCEFLRYNGRADNEFVFNGVKMIDLCKYEVIGSIHDKEK